MRNAGVIFDIDGTLVDSAEFDGRLYVAAVREVLGDVSIRPSWGDYQHVTDSGILRRICQDNGLDVSGCEHLVKARFGELVSEHLRRTGSCNPLPGALRLFDELCDTVGVHVGIATGGWGHTARVKLNHAGFDVSRVPIASSDDGHERIHIMERCRTMMPAVAQTIYVGDGEWDREASEILGWRFIGVGNRLCGRCQHWLPDFSTPQVLDALFG
jgi:phosphoglycolate phosphatase-like HAD superfamily hydrolase